MNHPKESNAAEDAVKNLMELTPEEKEQRRLKPKGRFWGNAEVTSAVTRIVSGDRSIKFRDDCLIILCRNRWGGHEDAVFITSEEKFNLLWDALDKIRNT